MLVIFGPLLRKYTNHPFIPKNAAVSSDVGIFPRNSAASLPQLLVVLNMISVKKKPSVHNLSCVFDLLLAALARLKTSVRVFAASPTLVKVNPLTTAENFQPEPNQNRGPSFKPPAKTL